MKFNRNITAALVLAVLGTTAVAQTEKLPEPLRGGNRVVGESGLTLNALTGRAPAYPAHTREHVKAELADAIRTGDIVVGESGLKRNELTPGSYPARPTVVGKTREQVKAETAEAIRTGDIVWGESALKLNEQFPHRYANVRKKGGADTALSAGTAKPARSTP
jgi:hypothetical protein